MPGQGNSSEGKELKKGGEALSRCRDGAGLSHLTWQESGEASDQVQDHPLSMFNIQKIILSMLRV